MSRYTLTQLSSSQKRREDEYTKDTVDLINYGNRDGGTTAEYDLANRLAEMREIAIELINELAGYGEEINETALQYIDVEGDVTVTKRYKVGDTSE